MRYLLLAVLTFAGCAPISPTLTWVEKQQITLNKYKSQGVKTLQDLDNLKRDLKRDYHDTIGPSTSFDRYLEARFERSILEDGLEDESMIDRLIASLFIERVKDPETKKKLSEWSPKTVVSFANLMKPGIREKFVAILEQQLEELEAELAELLKVVEQEILLASLKYENKRLRQQRAALALSVMGQSLQNAGQTLQQSEQSQAFQDQQFYQLQMLNKQNEILRQLRMQELRRNLIPFP